MYIHCRFAGTLVRRLPAMTTARVAITAQH